MNHKVKEPRQFSGKKTIQKQETLGSWSLNTSRHTVATQDTGHSGLKIHFDSVLLLLFVECPTSLLKQTKNAIAVLFVVVFEETSSVAFSQYILSLWLGGWFLEDGLQR